MIKKHYISILDSVLNERKVRLKYIKRGGRTVTRYVSPYEFKNGYLFADHEGRTKSFHVGSIVSASETTLDSEPVYPVSIT